MASLRVLLVEGSRETTDRVERTLRRDLPRSARIVRASRAPGRIEGFDVAVVVVGGRKELARRVVDLPTVVVAGERCSGDTKTLARRGMQHAVSEACATCPREPSLASTLEWTVQGARRLRELERASERAILTAHRDGLTGLPNAETCRERLRHLLAQARRKKKRVAVLYFDLDRFKEVNDHLGHAAGDRLLRTIARRLRARARETDTVARIGGDEFVILLDDVRCPNDALRVAQEMLACISRPIVAQETAVHASASIGVAVYPEDGGDGERLERQADLAMYAAKRGGGNRVVLAGDLLQRTSPSLRPRRGN